MSQEQQVPEFERAIPAGLLAAMLDTVMPAEADIAPDELEPVPDEPAGAVVPVPLPAAPQPPDWERIIPRAAIAGAAVIVTAGAVIVALNWAAIVHAAKLIGLILLVLAGIKIVSVFFGRESVTVTGFSLRVKK